jgi:lysophospholipase
MQAVLYQRTRELNGARAAMVFIHGFGEHSGRYEHVFERVSREGCASFAVDLRGHGQSSGIRGHVDRFDEYLDDVDRAVELATERWAGLPLFLVGHSMGGLIATRWAQDRSAGRIKGLVLSSPAFGFELKLPRRRRLLAWIATRLKPTLRRDTSIEVPKLSHDPEIVLGAMQDELCQHSATARWYTEMVRAQADALAAAGGLQVPLLMIVAGEDAIVDPIDSRAFFDAVGGADKTWHDYPDLYHELFNELGKERVFADLAAWLEGRA